MALQGKMGPNHKGCVFVCTCAVMYVYLCVYTAREQTGRIKLCQVSGCLMWSHKWTEMLVQQRQEMDEHFTHIQTVRNREDPPRVWARLGKLYST